MTLKVRLAPWFLGFDYNYRWGCICASGAGRCGPPVGDSVRLRVSDGSRVRSMQYASLGAAIAGATVERRVHPATQLQFDLAGTYRLDAPVVLPPEISGTPEEPTVIEVRAAATATISGSHTLSVKCKPYKNGIFVGEVEHRGSVSCGSTDASDPRTALLSQRTKPLLSVTTTA